MGDQLHDPVYEEVNQDTVAMAKELIGEAMRVFESATTGAHDVLAELVGEALEGLDGMKHAKDELTLDLATLRESSRSSVRTILKGLQPGIEPDEKRQ